MLATTSFLLVVYFTIPLERDTNGVNIGLLVIGLVGFGYALVHSIRRIVDAPFPQLRAVETLATVLPLFIVIFALVYAGMSKVDAANYSEPLSKVSALYFTVTVLSTVGFGDITPTTDTARMVVTTQMIADLIIIGVVVRLIFGASRIGLQRRRAEAQSRTDES